MFFFRVKEASFEVKEAPNFTGRCSVIGRRCWRSTLKSGGAGSSVLLQGKGGKLRGKGGAKLYGKVFGDRPPLLEVGWKLELENLS